MKTLIPVLCLISMSFGALEFTIAPSLTKTGDTWQASLAVSESTDVEVAIINNMDSTIIRHLAAGVLGSNPPAPLTANSLSQTLEWDGKDDMGNAVTIQPSNLSVRVRAGMNVTLDNMAGGNMHYLQGPFYGFMVSRDGGVFVKSGIAAVGMPQIRQYDGDANYIRTIYPYPSSKPQSMLSGFGLITWPDNSYSPKNNYLAFPSFTLHMTGSASTILNTHTVGEIGFVNLAANQIAVINDDGTFSGKSAVVPLISGPENYFTDYYYGMGGPRYVCSSQDGKSYYLSGFFQNGSVSGQISVDTGFWRDGAVFKVNAATGEAVRWISLDSVPYDLAHRQAIGNVVNIYAAVHGVAVDDSGHVFVCDRLHSRISVYDTLGILLGSLPVAYPDLVEINRTDGSIYVLNRNTTVWFSTGYMKLFKFNGWRGNPAPVCSLLITTNISDELRARPFMGLSLSGARPMIWFGCQGMGVQVFRDDGNAFVKAIDFMEKSRVTPYIDHCVRANVPAGFDRMAVDPRRETVYFNNSYSDLFKIEDWSNPVIEPCSTSTGKLLSAGEFGISSDNQFYVREDRVRQLGQGFDGPITRYTLDHYHAPIPFPNSGSNMLTPWIYGRYAGFAGYGDHGLGVAPDKRVASIFMVSWCRYIVGVFPDSGSADSGHYQDSIPFGTTADPRGGNLGCGGVQFDAKGNLYVGTTIRSPEYVIPSEFATDYVYDQGVGAVVRFPKNVNNGYSGSINVTTNIATGSDYVYRAPLSPFSGRGASDPNGYCCMCRTPRFQVDPYGRIIMPHALANQVNIVDNNDNLIVSVGKYGNVDQKGTLDTVASPDIPLGWPVAAGMTDNYLYISDMVNNRIVRVKMNYVLDNMPGIGHTVADNAGANNYSSLQLTAAPSPFNPAVSIMLTGAHARGVSLKIFDPAGKLVADLSDKISAGRAIWNAAGNASGMYVVVAQKAGMSLTKKIIYSK